MERRKFFLFAAGSVAALMTGALAEPWNGHDDHSHGSHGSGGGGGGGAHGSSGGGGAHGGSGDGGSGGGGSHADHFGSSHGDHFGGGGHDEHFGGGHGGGYGSGGYGNHFGGDHDRYWRPEYGQRRYVDRDRIFFNLRRRHYSRFIGDPYWFQGRYVVRTYDRWGNVIFVEIDPYSGDFLGVVRF